MTNTASMKETIRSLKGSDDRILIGQTLGALIREVPKALENIELFDLALDLVISVYDRRARTEFLGMLLKGMPCTGPFRDIYRRAMKAAITTADVLPERHHRTTELLKLAQELPVTEDFEDMRVWAWRLALGLPAEPRHEKPALEDLAKELPKSKDYSFYRGYTLLGMAARLPTHPPFLELYREAIALALEATAQVDEPYYKRYALAYITKELAGRPGCEDLFLRAFMESYQASMEIKDNFAREHALVDLLRDIPFKRPFYDLILKIMEEALAFFRVRSWMEDVEVTDVVDFIFSAEELSLKDSKKKKFSREKYAKRLAKIIEKRGPEFGDIRLIDVLRPYTHVWIKPGVLREAAKKTVARIEALKKTFHGLEIERPVLVGGTSLAPGTSARSGPATVAEGCVAIDLGATNTLVMRRRPGQPPEFVPLDPLSINYGGAVLVPTVISRETDTIGAEVFDEDPVVNIKQMILEGKEEGASQMERFLRVLYRKIEGSVVRSGWFKVFSGKKGDVLYITVPIGFTSYRNTLEGIARRVFKGLDVEFIEEPLAAAVGYQVAGEEDSVIMMIDFGGCTLDCMVLRLNRDGVQVIAKPERAQVLGGHDIDRWIAELLAKKAGFTGEIMRPLLLEAEKIKIALSEHQSVPFEWHGRRVAEITRYDLEEALDAHDFYRLVDRTINYVLARAAKVGLNRKAIDAVILTGGSSQIPSFRDKVSDIFPELRAKNLVFDHSPLTAVAEGAALYGTRDIVDRHLGMAYAVRHVTGSKEDPFTYTIVMEKGESLPVRRSFTIRPAMRLGAQKEVLIEIYEVPEALVARRWVEEDGVELLKQKIVDTRELYLNSLKSVKLTLPSLPEAHDDEVPSHTLELILDENGNLSMRWEGTDEVVDTGVRLQ